jgi:hypothetical protein
LLKNQAKAKLLVRKRLKPRRKAHARWHGEAVELGPSAVPTEQSCEPQHQPQLALVAHCAHVVKLLHASCAMHTATRQATAKTKTRAICTFRKL